MKKKILKNKTKECHIDVFTSFCEVWPNIRHLYSLLFLHLENTASPRQRGNRGSPLIALSDSF